MCGTSRTVGDQTFVVKDEQKFGNQPDGAIDVSHSLLAASEEYRSTDGTKSTSMAKKIQWPAAK